MKYPLWIAGLAFVVLCSLLALSGASWHLAGVPVWQWAAALAAGGLGMLGARVMQIAPADRSHKFRAWVIGTAYGLPMIFISLTFPVNKTQHLYWASLPSWIVGASVFGLIMANVNRAISMKRSSETGELTR
jgi:hypothetical protein